MLIGKFRIAYYYFQKTNDGEFPIRLCKINEKFPCSYLGLQENKIDPLYANIVQKLNKFFPGYFQFPTVEEWTEIINYNPALQNGENQQPQDQLPQMQQVQQMGQTASVGNGGGMEEESY